LSEEKKWPGFIGFIIIAMGEGSHRSSFWAESSLRRIAFLVVGGGDPRVDNISTFALQCPATVETRLRKCLAADILFSLPKYS
jgi:hypothetical protein